MTPEEMPTLEKRKAGFEQFYKELMPVVVDFVGKLGINPAHEVLKRADEFVPYLDRALQAMVVADEQDRAWLLTRMGYFIGEYFVQKHGGCWYVNEVQGSRYFGRYVVVALGPGRRGLIPLTAGPEARRLLTGGKSGNRRRHG